LVVQKYKGNRFVDLLVYVLRNVAALSEDVPDAAYDLLPVDAEVTELQQFKFFEVTLDNL
jgi:hypothetical protein